MDEADAVILETRLKNRQPKETYTGTTTVGNAGTSLPLLAVRQGGRRRLLPARTRLKPCQLSRVATAGL